MLKVFRMAIFILSIILVGCVGTPNSPPPPIEPGATKVVTFLNDHGAKEAVYDLNGIWSAEYLGYSHMQEVEFTQNKNSFIGVKTIGDNHVQAGEKTLKGTLKDGGFEKAYVYHSTEGWNPCKGIIEDNGNKITFESYSVNIILKRK